VPQIGGLDLDLRIIDLLAFAALPANASAAENTTVLTSFIETSHFPAATRLFMLLA
jgi:hypothetical protein